MYSLSSPFKRNEEICPACGTRQTQEEVVEEEDPYKGYWKKPILWILSAVLCLSAVFLGVIWQVILYNQRQVKKKIMS